MKIQTIVTMPPYARYMEEVLQHPNVSGIRLNTIMPLKESLESLLNRMRNQTIQYNKEFWLDLKCRQLRVKNFGVPPFTEIELTHNIEVYTPCKVYFSERNEQATLLEVAGNKLIMQEGPKRVVGPGESVTIPHPTLKIEGYLTDGDKKYIEAAEKIGIKKYMLSFVEKEKDIDELRKFVPDAEVIAKIESQRGLDYINNRKINNAILMAARGDLYMELEWPHEIIKGIESIIEKDKRAIVGSRILSSLASYPEPTCEDLGDLDNLLRMGYKNLMLGDEVCLRRESVISALNVIGYIKRKYGEEKWKN